MLPDPAWLKSPLRCCGFARRYRLTKSILSVLLIFAASRLVVIIGVNFGKLLVRDPDPAQWDAGNAWYYRLLRWDSGWYFSIIHDGYRYSDNASVENSTVFYPLYPLVSYAVKDLFHIDGYLALLLVANVASLAVVLLTLIKKTKTKCRRYKSTISMDHLRK